MNDIVAAAKKVADIIGEISSASQQQASGLDPVNGAIMQMDESTQQNAAMAAATSAVAASMTSQAKELIELISVFKIEEDGRRSSMRAVERTYSAPSTPAPSSHDESEYAEPEQRVANY